MARYGFTVFDEAEIADDQVGDGNLLNVPVAHDGRLLVLLDFALKAAKLPFLSPIIKRRDEHDDEHGDQNGDALDPFQIG